MKQSSFSCWPRVLLLLLVVLAFCFCFWQTWWWKHRVFLKKNPVSITHLGSIKRGCGSGGSSPASWITARAVWSQQSQQGVSCFPTCIGGVLGIIPGIQARVHSFKSIQFYRLLIPCIKCLFAWQRLLSPESWLGLGLTKISSNNERLNILQCMPLINHLADIKNNVLKGSVMIWMFIPWEKKRNEI